MKLNTIQTAMKMKDKDHVNILDVLNSKIASDMMEKFFIEMTNFLNVKVASTLV